MQTVLPEYTPVEVVEGYTLENLSDSHSHIVSVPVSNSIEDLVNNSKVTIAWFPSFIIDWKLAPEGTTHCFTNGLFYLNGSPCDPAFWEKWTIDGNVYVWDRDRSQWKHYRGSPFSPNFLEDFQKRRVRKLSAFASEACETFAVVPASPITFTGDLRLFSNYKK